MKKMLTALVTVAALAAAAVGMSSTADAHWNGPGWGRGWGPGPFVAGAIVGSALAAAATAPYGPYYGPACRPVWNGYNWVQGCY
jgi:hypothetical protein